MLQQLVLDVLVNATAKTVPLQQEDGRVPAFGNDWGYIGAWALAYTEEAEDNPFYRDPKVLESIIRYGDYNARSVTAGGGFEGTEVDWRFYGWFEAMELIRGELDDRRLAEWTAKLVLGGEGVMRVAVDMDTFDGQVPNHGIWGHAMLHRIGQLCDRSDFVEMAVHSLHRDFQAQTADGCFREGTTAAGLPGTPVTAYNIISANAIEQYHARSGDDLARQALDKAWHWWREFLLPDFSSPPNFDFRQAYQPEPYLGIPAMWANKPEARAIILPGWKRRRDQMRSESEPLSNGNLCFSALKYPLYQNDVDPGECDGWSPELSRMRCEEAGVRRRRPWAVALSGMTNIDLWTNSLRLWGHERQDGVAVWHEKHGLLVGSAHGLVQEELSTFVFYEGGEATYLHNKAYLKATPPLDTLMLRYGRHVGAVSVDSRSPDLLKLTFSLHGELGRSTHPGSGFPHTAMCAKAHLALRCQSGDVLRIEGDGPSAGKSWTLGDDPSISLRLRVEAGETLDFGGWSITCPEGFWEFRWPVRTLCPYTLFDGVAEELGLLEVVLYHQISGPGRFGGPYQRPSAGFELRVGD